MNKMAVEICSSIPNVRVRTIYPKKYAHGFDVLCFVVVMQSFIMNSHEVFIHIHQGCFAGTGAIVRLPQCQWSKPDGYGKISQCITTTKHSKAKTVCIFLGIYCIAANRPAAAIVASACDPEFESDMRQANCLSLVGIYMRFPVLAYICHKNCEKETPPLQWNKCLCTLWPYSQSSLALFVGIPNFFQAVIRMFNRLLTVKEEIIVLFSRLTLPNLARQKNSRVIYFQYEVRQSCFCSNNSDGFF